MEKTTRYAEIPEIKKGVAFSDPSYDETVWCQYRKEFNAQDWLMKLETSHNEDGYINMSLYLGRPTLLSSLTYEETEQYLGEITLSYPSRFESKEIEIGIDTAKVFVGSLKNFEENGEEGSIYTGADGAFGNMFVFTCKGETAPAGFLLLSALDGGLSTESGLFQTLLSSFFGKEIDRDKYISLTSPDENFDLRMQIASEIKQANAEANLSYMDPNVGLDVCSSTNF